MNIYDILLSKTYSAESQKLISHGLIFNEMFAVSKLINLNGVIDKKIFYKIVEYGWGKEYLPYTFVNYVDETIKDMNSPIEFTENLIKNGRYYFVFCLENLNDKTQITISINHIFSDEYSLLILENMLKDFIKNCNQNELINVLKRGKMQYREYVNIQKKCKKEQDLTMKIEFNSNKYNPIKFKNEFKVDRNFGWNVLNFHCSNLKKDKNMILKLINLLKKYNYVEGNMYVQSKNWRSSKQNYALGMATGLIPCIVEENISLVDKPIETLASCDKGFNDIMKKCFKTDLYIYHSISDVYTYRKSSKSFRFPVGISFDSENEKIRVEGCFCFPELVNKILKNLWSDSNEFDKRRNIK